MTYTCPRCTMTFHVVDQYPDHGEVTRCGESACRMAMHTATLVGRVRAKVLYSEAQRRSEAVA